MFPEISAEEKRALRKSIKATGLRNGVTLWVDGETTYLLDGRSRLDALESLGIQVLDKNGAIHRDHVEGEHNALSSFGAAQLVTSLNIRRRHLTPGQRADLAVAAIKAEREMKKGDFGKGFPKSPQPHRSTGEPVGRPRGDASEVAETAGVSKPTARKAMRKATGEKPKRDRRSWISGIDKLAAKVASIPREEVSDEERISLMALWEALGSVLGIRP